MDKSAFPVVVIGILIFCIWQALPLFYGWVTSPYDTFNWLPFLVWLLPLAWMTTRNSWYLPALAIFFVIVGIVAEFNTFKYFALALIVAWWVPATWGLPFWLMAAVSWMPGLSYALVAYPFFWVMVAKIVLAAAGSLILIRSFNRDT